MALQNYLTTFQTAGGFDNGNAIAGGSQGVIVAEQWALEGNGVPPSYFQSSVTIGAADNILSTYLIAKNLPANVMLASLLVEADAIASARWDVGIFDPKTGVAVVQNCYTAAANWTAGTTKLVPADGLAALTHEQTKQAIWQVIAKTLNTTNGCYDLVLTAQTAPTGAGVITFRGLWTPPG